MLLTGAGDGAPVGHQHREESFLMYKYQYLERGEYMITPHELDLLPVKESKLLEYLIDAEEFCATNEHGRENYQDFLDDYEYEVAYQNFVSNRLMSWSRHDYKTTIEALEAKGYITLSRVQGNNEMPYICKINHYALEILSTAYSAIIQIRKKSSKSIVRNHYSLEAFGMKYDEFIKFVGTASVEEISKRVQDFFI